MDIHYFIACCGLWRLMFYGVFVLSGALAIVFISLVNSGLEEVTRAGGVTENGIMPGSPNQAFNKKSLGAQRIAIYVLGGTQHSLRLKYRTAADLYKKEGIEKIMVATSDDITEYDKDIDRNLTNDEWTIKQLARQGVKLEGISFIKLKDGFFGTLREARTLRELCVEKGIERLLLVCSAYHSRRVLAAFSRSLEDTGVEVEICVADEQVGLRGFLYENVKLFFYKYVLIPLDRWLIGRRQSSGHQMSKLKTTSTMFSVN